MRRNYYHCSETNHDQYLLVKRQYPKVKADKETFTPRLCVAPTIAACLAARLLDKGPLYVYKTIKPVNAIKPKDVWDLCITRERWLIPPNKLEQHDVISKHIVEECYTSIKLLYGVKKQRSSIRIRVCMYKEIIDTFKKHEIQVTTWEEQFINKCMAFLSIDVDYILNLANNIK